MNLANFAGQRWLGLAICCWAIVCPWEPAKAAELARFNQTQVHMGVEFEIVVYAAEKSLADQGIAAAFARIAELDGKLNDYNLESELSKLSASAPTPQPVPVSDDLFHVLSKAEQVASLSGGAFDATIGPLTKLWRRARRQHQLPDEAQLKEAFASVGYRKLQTDSKQRRVSLHHEKMRLDLGGIAKGFAADEGLKTLAKSGIARALVRASGDIAAGDPPPGEMGWKVGLAPLNPTEEPTTFVYLKQQAISTSGEARQHLIVNGRRYSHLIDPRTGQPLSGRLSVTVIAPRGIEADALASAVAVLGPEQGNKLIDSCPETSALMITAADDGTNVQKHASARFATVANE
ncbi:Thiamine biosynthesis lipoprotein ApbE precursor [Anatilimnocola aggregata]|uniref:FAD:protein FMN transferase n=1 Tax=Anatilimnocola aggregata TaxID=2528021 RepID=A0A517YKG1_9BACT|nr:FAD:protein FMN transferase [Anatilimnocola aggregata]QDU30712.1 Thiamine biosynthesis lipoprotein ApbE precursor [Anatilimnocola aggregata]